MDVIRNEKTSTLFKQSGMLYFEYDPKTHIAVRPDYIDESKMPDVVYNYPECIIEKAVPDLGQAQKYRDAFLKMDGGSKQETFDVQMEMYGQVYWFRYNLAVTGDERDRIACVATNVTEDHIEHSIEKILLWKQYETICIMDVVKETLNIRYSKENVDVEKFFYKNENKDLLDKISIDAIKDNLRKNTSYKFVYKGKDDKGDEYLYKYSFYYLDETKRMILTTLENVTQLVEHDVLTGEYNRNGFIRFTTDYLNNCSDRKEYAILFFNIKGFKAINDLVGVEGGDRVLCGCVETLKDSFLKPIAISRFEADHFVLLIELNNLDYEKLGQMCHRDFEMNGKEFRFYGRCGIYPLTEKEHDVSGMCDRAKIAKQFITDDYVKPYAIYNQTMKESFVKKKKLLSGLENGVRNNEFEVYYQPIYGAKTEKIVSAEALVRWVHPEYGVVSPGEFIATFEENGYISQLDMLVESRTKEFILDRLRKNSAIVPIAINLSRMDFYDRILMEKIIRDVTEMGNYESYARFEITESAYTSLNDNATGYMGKFKKQGLKILLDDFGSGYSSFSTITDFDFDILKLDMGFIRKIGISKKVEGVIVNIIKMAHDLKLEVIAEGVETNEQRLFLVEHDCDYIQGFYYSKPLKKADFVALLDKDK